MEKKVAIIILTCNQKELVKKCLISISKNEYKNYKIFLIDDSGKGEIGREIKKEFPKVNVTINEKNMGYATSLNIGMKKAIKKYSPDYIFHLDDDTELIEKNSLKKMIEIAESNEKAGILGCKLIYPEGNLQWFFQNGKMNFLKNKKKIEEKEESFQTKDVKDIIGACFLIKKEVIDKIGFFDEKFSPLYGEETDFCYRARFGGFKMIYIGNTKVIHHGSASEKKLKQDGGKWFLQKRNSIRFEWLNFDVFNITKYTFIHFGSAILNKNPFLGLKLLLKAYKINIKDFKEIKQKRKERFSWKHF